MSIKKQVTNEVLEKYLQLILGVDSLEDMKNYFFNLETLRKKKSVKKYLGENMGDYLREYLVVNKNAKISKKNEKILNEKDLVTIMRYIIKNLDYVLLSISDFRVYKTTIYTLMRNNEHGMMIGNTSD